jgi:DNA-binding response OmpR family regulator
MAALARVAGNVVRREALIAAGWGDDPSGGPDNVVHVMHTHIASIRRGMASAGFPGRIKTVWGIGYELTLGIS